jgi:hypothetical protein
MFVLLRSVECDCMRDADYWVNVCITDRVYNCRTVPIESY